MPAGFPALRLADINIATGMLFTGSTNVIINKRPAVRMGDLVTAHPAGGRRIHYPNPVLTGSAKVLINRRPAGQVARSIETLQSPPHPWMGTGSQTVLTGG
jgi:uncharacterized Zn-binding protein involved in type VI secretion